MQRHGSRLSLRGLASGRGRAKAEEIWALRDVSLTVPAGTSTALIGGNGAGKSTLLRIAAGLSAPTAGSLAVPADTVAVLGLGRSFDGELTGAENALTALVVNGMSRRAAAAQLPAVCAFAQLEGFFDRPVRTYSAGMTLRLAFGVATRLTARAILVDEVLSVGDLAFQARCLEHLRGLRAGGATILLATHDLQQARALCDRAVWLERGRVRLAGPAAEVIAAYRDAMRARTVARTPPPGAGRDGPELGSNRFGTQRLRLEDVRLDDRPAARIEPGEGLRIDARLVAAPDPTPAIAGVTIWRASDELVVAQDHVDLGAVDGDQELSVAIERLDLAPGAYFVDVGLYDADWSVAYDYHWSVYRLEVGGERGGPDDLLRPPVRWSLGAPDAAGAGAREGR